MSAISRPQTSTSLSPSRPGSRSTRSPSRPGTGASTSASPAGSRLGSAGSSSRSRPSSGASVAWENVEEGNLEEVEEEQIDTSILEEEEDETLIKGEDDIPKGCWYAVTHTIGQFWSTKDTDDVEDREHEIRTTIRELAIYLIFVADLCILTFYGTSDSRYMMNSMLLSHLESIEEVEQIPDLWKFLEKDLIPAIYEEKWYNDGDTDIPCPDGTKGVSCIRVQEDRNVLYENKMLGVPRLRQLKVNNASCNIPMEFSNNIKVCYGPYSGADEDRNSFSPGHLKFTDSDAWRFQSSKELGTGYFWGKLGWYGGGGFVQNLHTTRERSEAIIRELREFLWIDRGTRLLTLDFTLYNSNVNFFSVVKIAFEFPPTGGLLKSLNIRTIKLIRYVSDMDYFLMAFEIIFMFLVIYYCIEEILEFSKKKFEYFQNAWNCMDMILICTSLFYIAMSMYVQIVIGSLLKPLLAEPETHGNFEELSWWFEQLNNVFAVNVFFCWLKIFKYISFNRTMVQLQDTLSRCAPDVIAFLFMFMIVFMAYAQFAYLIFGTKIESFSDVKGSAMTLMRAMLGDFDFPGLQAAHYILGPAFFFGYIFIVFFILLNMFLAIINDTYSEVKTEMEDTKVQFEISDFFMRGYNNILGSVAMRDKMIDIENAIKLANADGIVTYEEIRMELKKCDFSNQEIELFFGKSDADGDGTLDVKESGDAVEDIHDDTLLQGDVIKHPTAIVTNGEFGQLESKVQRLEHSIGSIITKIDSVLGKLDVMENKTIQIPAQGDEAGNGTFLLDLTSEGKVEDYVPGDGDEGNATFT